LSSSRNVIRCFEPAQKLSGRNRRPVGVGAVSCSVSTWLEQLGLVELHRMVVDAVVGFFVLDGGIIDSDFGVGVPYVVASFGNGGYGGYHQNAFIFVDV
jgi:hypothetical protein